MPAPDALLGLRLVCLPTTRQLDEVYELRAEAWRSQARLKSELSGATDRWDAMSEHRIFVDDTGGVAAAFRFSLHDDLSVLADLPDGGVWLTPFHDQPGPHAYFSRMFISPMFQGLGLSEYLDRLAVSEPLMMGAETITCLAGSVEASLRRIPQMIRRGWTQIGAATTASPAAFWQADHQPVILACSRAKP